MLFYLEVREGFFEKLTLEERRERAREVLCVCVCGGGGSGELQAAGTTGQKPVC